MRTVKPGRPYPMLTTESGKNPSISRFFCSLEAIAAFKTRAPIIPRAQTTSLPSQMAELISVFLVSVE